MLLTFIRSDDPRVEDMHRRKKIYHRRLRVVIDGFAWFNGHETATHDDVMEAQRMMDDEYLAACRC